MGVLLIILAPGVLWAIMGDSYGQRVEFSTGLVGVVVGGLARLRRPLMVTCIYCIIMVFASSANLALSTVLSKQVVMSNCLEAEKRCSGMDPRGRILRLFAKRPIRRLARNAARGFGLERVSIREREEVFWRVRLYKLAEVEDCILESIRDCIHEVWISP
jgi:hypothetical protein